jgi:mannose-6-phosphate isomerase class I
MIQSNFNNHPFLEAHSDYHCLVGWEQIIFEMKRKIASVNSKKIIVAIEYYQGVLCEEITPVFQNELNPVFFISTVDLFREYSEISQMVFPDVTNNRLFGFLSRLTLPDYFNRITLREIQQKIDTFESGMILIVGPGSALVAPDCNLLIYADMARWEIQLRMRAHEVDNLGMKNRDTEDWMLLYKQGYFVDWRVLDKWKKKLFNKIDYFLDTNDRKTPKLALAEAVYTTIKDGMKRPFSVVPFFDPAPWGGQWMKNHCNLDQDKSNFGWCFNCVPEENSLLLKFGTILFEIPSINVVFIHPVELLGDRVHARFGDEFPIRFDYLDTVEGGNLSLQVHPLTEYIQEKFGIQYTQDESYYIFYAKEGAQVFLGLKEEINSEAMIRDLKMAQNEDSNFETEKYVPAWPVKTHDHLLIPAGTVHCSGKDCMVLEISATPYIFTFKMWDWDRLGLDGKPRPINIDHAANVIQWNRVESWTRENLINRIELIQSGDGWIEEKTGLHEREFIETRRFWFSKSVDVTMSDSVYVGCVIEGEEISIECPSRDFEPFTVHYAETFIVPAQVKNFRMKPSNLLNPNPCAVILAFVR